MRFEDAREDDLDIAFREEAVAVVPPGEVEVKKMESGDDLLVHGARKSSSGFTTDVVAEDIGIAQSQVAVAGSVNSTAEAPVSAVTEPSADVDTGPASSSDVEESTKKVESSDWSKVVEESAGNSENSKPNFAEGGTLECIKTQASSDLIADAPTSSASVQDSAGGAAMSIPSADVEEKAVEVSSEDAEVVSKELNADVAASEEVSSKILDEGFAEKCDNEASAVPVEEVKLVAQEAIRVNRNEAIATLEAAPPRSVDVQERCVELDNKDAGALNDDVSPQIEDSGSAKKDDSEALTDRVEEYQEITDTATSANPDEDTSSLEASISPSVNIGEESVELSSKDVGPVSEGVGLSIVDEGLTEKGDGKSPSAALEVVEEVEDASTRTEPDEHLASLNAVPSLSVDVGVKSTDLKSNHARALNEHISPLIDEGGSAEISESEAPEAAVEEVHGLAEATTSAALDDDGAGLEAALSPSSDVGEISVKLDSVDVAAVSDDVSTVIQEEEFADKGDNDAPVAPVEGASEIPEAKISSEPDEAVGSLDAEPPPSVDVGVQSVEVDSEGTRALNADVGPRIEEEVPAEKGDADAAEAPVEEAHDVAAATSSVEADPDAAGLEAAPSPTVDVGDKSVELNSERAGAESEDASLKTEGEGSAKNGEITTTEAPAKEGKESAGVAPSVEPEEDAASLDAPPSSSVGLTSVEADAEDAETLNENVSTKIEDEGSAAEKGESEEIAPPEEVNNVAEPRSIAEALEAAPSFANVEKKSLELDPEVARSVSEDVSHEIQDEGSAEKGDREAPDAPGEEVHEVAEAAPVAEPLETSPSPVVDVEEKPLELGSEAVRASSVDASPEIEDEGSAAEKGHSKASAPAEKVTQVTEPITSAEPLEAAPLPFANVKEKSFDLDPEVAPAVSEDVGPEIEDEGLAEKGDNEVPDEEIHEVTEAPTNAEPDEDVAALEAAPSPVADVGDKSVEQNSEGAGAENEDASLKSEGEGSAKKADSTGTEAPAKEVNESAGVAPSAEPEEDAASLDALPSDSVGLTSVEADAEDAGTVNENVSPKIEDEGSAAEKGESEAPAPAEVVNEVAKPTTTAEPLEAAPSPFADGEDNSFELDPEVAPAVSKDVRPEIEDEGLAEKGESEAPEAPAEEVREGAEAATDAEPDEDVATLETAPSPTGDVGEESVELDYLDAVTADENVKPEFKDEGSANKGESEAPVVPVEESNDVAEAGAHVEPDEAVPSHEDVPSSSAEFAEDIVDVDDKSIDLADKAVGTEDKSVEVSSGDVGAVSEELPAEVAASEGVSPTIPDEESVETSGSEAAVAPVEELDDVAEATASAEPDEVVATLEASPSPFVDVKEKPVELGSGVARALSVDASRENEAEGSAAEKGESETPAAADEVNEVAEPLAIAEPLDAAPSPLLDVEAKSFELDPLVARAVSEDVTPEIGVEGLAAEKGVSEAPVIVEQMNEGAEAAANVESNEAMASLDTMPSPSAEVEEKLVDVDDKSVNIDDKPVAVNPKPADFTDRSGGAGDVAFAREELYAEDPAIVEESPKTLDEGSAEQGESEVHEAPVEEGHEVAEVAINAEPDAHVASAEATPSPSAHARGISAQAESDNAVAVGVDVSLQFEDVGSGENGGSEAPEARVDEVQEVAEATSGAEPAEDASRLDSAISPSLDARERGVELNSEDSRAAASVDVSENFEDEVLADEGNSAAPEASVEGVREIPSVTTTAEHDEIKASLDAEPLPSVNAGERDIELDSDEARALNEVVSPTVEDFGSAEKGDSVARETPLEEVHEVAAPTSTVEAHPGAASVETAPSPFVDVGELFHVKDIPVDVESTLINVEHKQGDVADNCGGIEDKFVAVNAGDVGVVREELFAEVPASVEASPNFPGEGSAETVGLESPRALVEEVQVVAEAATPVEGNETVTNLDAVLPRSAHVEETSVVVESEDVRVVSEDVSPEIEGEGWAEKGGSSARESPIEVDQEVAEATTIAQPDEVVASLEAAPSPSVHLREASVDVDSEDPGALNEVSSPLIEAKLPAEKDDTEAAQAPMEEVQEVAGTTTTTEPDVDAAGVDAVRAPVVKLDSEVAGAMTENVSSKTERVGLAEEGECAPPEAPLEETNDVAEAITPVVPDEAVASLEAAPPPSVDVRERYVELNSDIAGTLNVDSSPQIGDGETVEQGGTAAADAPIEEDGEVAERTTSVEPVEVVTISDAAPAVDAGERSVELSNEDAGAVNEDVSPNREDEGSAEKDKSEAPDAPLEKVREFPEAAVSAEREVVEASLDTDFSPSADAGVNSEGARALNEDISPTIEEGGLDEKDDSEVPKASLEELHVAALVSSSVEADPDSANVEAAPSPSVDLNCEDAGGVREDTIPKVQVEGLAEKIDSAAPEVPAEEAHEVTEATPRAEHEEDGASVDASPSPSVGETSVTVDVEDAGTLNENVSPKIEDKRTAAEKGESEAPGPAEEVNQVAEPLTIAEPLEAAPPPFVDVKEKSLELDPEAARRVSEDASPEIDDEGSAEKGDIAVPDEEVHEVTQAPTIAEPDKDVATLEAAPSPVADVGDESAELDSEDAVTAGEDVSPEFEDEGSADEGESEVPVVPVEEGNEIADAAAHAEPDETVPSHEDVPPSSAEFAEQIVDVDDKSVDLADKGVGLDDKSVEVSSGDVGEVSEELPAEVAASEGVSLTIPDEESAETSESEAAVAPVEEVDEVAEAAISAEPDEKKDVVSLEAAPSSSVDIGEEAVELDSVDARAVSVDASPVTGAEGSAAEKGDSAVPEEEVHELTEATTNAEPDEDVATLEGAPSPVVRVEEKPLELGSDVARALSVDVSPNIRVDGSAAENRESEGSAPLEEINEDTEPITNAEPLEVARSPFADVEEKYFELDPEVAGPLSEDVSPKIEDTGSAEKGDRETPEVPLEEVNEVAESAATLETTPSPSAEVEEKLVDVDDKSVNIDDKPVAVEPEPADVADRSGGVGDVAFAKEDLHAEDPANAEDSPKTVNEGSAEHGESEVHEAPVEEGHKVAEAAINAEPDARVASVEATPSTSVHGGGTSAQPESESAVAVGDDVSLQFGGDGCGEAGESEAPEAAVLEVHELAEATTSAALDDDVAGLEAALSPSSDVDETYVKLDPEDVGAVSDDVSAVAQDEESADKGGNDTPVAPVEGACEIPEAKISSEPDEAVGSLDAEPPPSVYVGGKSVEVDSEGTRALNADVGPRIEEEVPAEKGDADAAEAPLQEVHDVAAATSSVEADPDAAGLEAAPSPSVDVGDKSVELNSERAGAESEDASLKTEGEGSAKNGEITTTEAPAKEGKESAGVAPSVEPEEDAASLDAPPSSSVGLTSVEADAEDAETLNENVSTKIEDEGSAAEKGESEEIAPPEEVNNVAEPRSIAEALEAAPSSFANVEKKSLELDPEVARSVSEDVSHEIQDEGSAEKGDREAPDAPGEEVHEVAEAAPVAEPLETSPSPVVDVEEKSFELAPEVARAVSEDVSPEIEDEGMAAEKGDNEAPAPVEQMNEGAEAATDVEPDDATASLETMPSPSAEAKEIFLDVDDKSVDIGNKPVAVEPEPADVTDRSGGIGDVAFAKEDLHAVDPAIVEKSPKTVDEASAEQGESEAHEAPVEEGHEVAEVAINAEPDAHVASAEATPSPSIHAGGISAQPESDNAVAVGDHFSFQLDDGGSGEASDSEAPEARVDEVQEVAEATSGVDPAEEASRLDSAISPSLDARERGVELNSEDSRAAASVDVSENFEDEVLADEGNSAAPEASVEGVREIPSVTTTAEHNEVEASLETEPLPPVNAGERGIELDSEEAGAVSDDVRPVIKDEEWAKKGDSAVPEALVEVDQDVAKSSTGAEPDEAGASLDAKPLPCIDVGMPSIEPDSEETKALSEHSIPLIGAGGSVDKGDPEAAEAPIEQIPEVAGARSSAEPDVNGASLEAAISPSFDAIERPIELDSKDAGVASEDASSQREDGGSAKKDDCEAAEAYDKEVEEISIATTSAEPGDDAASEAALSPSVDIGDEGTAGDGESDTLDVPAEEVHEVAEAAVHEDPEEGAASPKAVPSRSAAVEEKFLHEEESSVDAPVDIDYKPRDVLLDNSVGIDDKIVEVKSGDVGVARDELPAEIPASEDVSPPFPNDGSTEKDYFGAPPAPMEVANEVAESTTPVEREAAAPRSVDVPERCFEQDSTDAGALNEDLRSQNEEFELAKKGDNVAAAAAEAPLEKFHEVAYVPTSAKADEYATSAETAPSPSLDIKEKSVELGSEIAGDVGEEVSPVTKHEGPAEKVERGAREAPVEEVNKVVNHEDPTEVTSLEAEPTPSAGAEEKTVSVEDVSDHKHGDVADKSDEIAEVDSAILQATPPHSQERSIELDSKAAGVLNEDFNESSVSAEKGDKEGTAPEAPAEEVSEVLTTSELDDVGAKSSEVRSEDAKAVNKDSSPHAEDEASRRPRKFRWVWWGLGTVVLSAFVASLFAIFSGQTGGLAVPFQVLPFLP